MVDTVRSLAALQTLLADNVAGDISAQDVRDFLVSSFGIHLIEEVELGAAGTITFSSIPAFWRDLHIVGRCRGTASGASTMTMRVGNGAVDSGANYSYGIHQRASSASGEQDSAAATQGVIGLVVGGNAAAGRMAGVEIKIMRYANTDFPRAWVANSGNYSTATAAVSNGGGEWNNSADAIDIITFATEATFSDLETGSTLALYGVGHV